LAPERRCKREHASGGLSGAAPGTIGFIDAHGKRPVQFRLVWSCLALNVWSAPDRRATKRPDCPERRTAISDECESVPTQGVEGVSNV
jgi:hypothetical protein